MIMAYAVAATWLAKPGQEAVVESALQSLAPLSRQEPGCRAYIVCRSQEEPRQFELFEVYDDEDAYLAHGASAHFQEFALGQGIPALEDRHRKFFDVLDV
jgi:quinol monooxygenase YgiN